MYNQTVQEHFHQPRRIGPLAEFTHQGTAGTPGEGPYMVLWFRVGADGRIAAAAYRTYGCPAAIAAASVAAELAEGRTLDEAAGLTEADIDAALGGLPEGKDHCPRLAVTALRNATATSV